jgi:hypothetical protein
MMIQHSTCLCLNYFRYSKSAQSSEDVATMLQGSGHGLVDSERLEITKHTKMEAASHDQTLLMTSSFFGQTDFKL